MNMRFTLTPIVLASSACVPLSENAAIHPDTLDADPASAVETGVELHTDRSSYDVGDRLELHIVNNLPRYVDAITTCPILERREGDEWVRIPRLQWLACGLQSPPPVGPGETRIWQHYLHPRSFEPGAEYRVVIPVVMRSAEGEWVAANSVAKPSNPFVIREQNGR